MIAPWPHTALAECQGLPARVRAESGQGVRVPGQQRPLRGHFPQCLFGFTKVRVITVQAIQAEFVGQGGDDGAQVKVQILYMKGEDSTRGQLLLVEFNCLAGEQMHRDGIRAIGIEYDQAVVVFRSTGQHQAGVSHNGMDIGTGIRQIGEKTRVLGYRPYCGINFIKSPCFLWQAVGCEGT